MSRVENLFSPVAQAMSIQPILWMALGSSNHPLITNEQYPPSFEPRRLRGILIPRFPRESKGTSGRLTSTWEYQENLRVSGRTHKQVRSEMMALTSPKRENISKAKSYKDGISILATVGAKLVQAILGEDEAPLWQMYSAVTFSGRPV